MTDREHRIELKKTLGERIGCPADDISDEHLESILRIMRGMYWNSKTARKVAVLAKEIKREMDEDDGTEGDG